MVSINENNKKRNASAAELDDTGVIKRKKHKANNNNSTSNQNKTATDILLKEARLYREQLQGYTMDKIQKMCTMKNIKPMKSSSIKDALINQLVSSNYDNVSSVGSITISKSQKQGHMPAAQLLVDGFIREQYIIPYKKLYPYDLTKIFCEFIDHIWVLPEKYKTVMRSNGSLIFRPPLEKMYQHFHGRRQEKVEINKQNIDMIIGYSRGYDKGLFEFQLKCINPATDAIGIMSEIEECTIKQWIAATKGNTYYYIPNVGIYSGKDTNNAPNEQYIGDGCKWETGDIIKMKVDCNNWTCEFYRNEEQVGNTINIEPNCTYHPVLATCKDGSEYELIMDYAL